MARFRTCSVFLGLVYFVCSCTAQVFYVVAPNTIRTGTEETVAVAMDGPSEQRVSMYLQDHPQRKRNISAMGFSIKPGATEIKSVKVLPTDVPDADFMTPDAKNFVILVVQSGNFKKEIKIPLSSDSGYVFLQTDKPIYNPKQSVKLRVIPVNEKTRPTDEQLKIQFKNPQGIIVEETDFNNNRGGASKKAFISHIYQFPPYPMLGIWTVAALHGHQLQKNTSIQFELREYVLPTFVLNLFVPEVILPNDETILVNVSARYVYGKKVKGIATFKYGVKDERGKVLYFGVSPPVELDNDGIADHTISTRELKDHKSIGWFPQIEGSYLVVEVSVRDEASGNKEVIMDHKCRFAKSPFIISFKRSLKDFKPGLVSIIEADIIYVNGRPAPGITTAISAVADNNNNIHISNPRGISDRDGRLSFEIQPQIHHKTIKITVKTTDPKLGNSQAEASFTQEKFSSKSGGYIAISKRSNHTIMPNHMFAENVHLHPPEMADVYYVVVSRGLIIQMGKFPHGKFPVLRLQFRVTYKMAPNFRVVVFAHHEKDLIADSVQVDVSEQCHPNSEVTIEPNFADPGPGNNGHILLRGFKNTLVGLLAVDEAVYALRNKDLLTRAKMFNAMKSHDMGCGAGGGRTTDAVLGNAGIVIATNLYSPPELSAFSTCEEKKRKKRELKNEYVQKYTGEDRECCKLGMKKDRLLRSCEVRSDIIKESFKNETSEACSSIFLDCCLFASFGRGRSDSDHTSNPLARNVNPDLADELKFINEDEEDFFEGNLVVRKDFRETWIFQDIIIGTEHTKNFPVSLPHSITTWMIQAVSVSHEWGMCVSTPKKVVSFKKVFLQLNLPYSVVRNEQIEIQAVVFNYGAKKLPVIVYMYGVEDLCSGTHKGEKSERKRIYVGPQSAESVTFPVIPLKEGDFDLKVVALSPEASDSIIRTLHVVAEGQMVEKDITVTLDPTNQQRRPKRDTITINDNYQDSIDASKNEQFTSIKLALPDNFVPGTESCVITALGDEFGPTVETCLQNPDNLLRKSVGCGEQTMIFLAPTMYTMNYLKAKGKITPEIEAKGYGLIRQGYERELTFRKADGSYSAFVNRPPSTWLTAFVMKVFCQASKLIHIDEATMCSGIRWLIGNQQPDGSFIDHHPVIHRDMMGGVQGLVPMTAFVLIALQECSCDDVKNLELARARSLQYIENHLGEVVEPLPVAIVSYVLALSGSELKSVAYDKLSTLEQYDEAQNALHWGKGQGSREVEVTSYGLLTQLQFNNMAKSNSIVNWLNKLRLASGSFPSTQDTVIALQALSEYEISSQKTAINLVSNITSSNDKNLVRTMAFHEGNSLVLQQMKVDKVGGFIFVNTAGHGVGLMSVKLRYNVPTPPEKLCKFHLTVNVSTANDQIVPDQPEVDLQPGQNDVFMILNPDLIRAVGADGGEKDDSEPVVRLQIDPRARPAQNESKRSPLVGIPEQQRVKIGTNLRAKRENKPKNSALTLKIEICTRYLGDHDADMTLVEAGVFSGFQPIKEDLEKLVQSNIDLVQKYETTSKGIVFYLEKAPKGIDYCFRFRVKREYMVGNTQSSVIKVYDYYNPKESCTTFYAPNDNSPMLRKICSNGICQCAEGGCPPKEPFKILSRFEVNDAEEIEIEQNMQEALRVIVCEKNDYAWVGKVEGKIKKEAGFLHVTFLIERVIKEGIEKANMLVGLKRTLLARDNCGQFIPEEDTKYVIMGKDGQRYLDEKGHLWYRYLLDRTSSIFSLKRRKSGANKMLLKTFKWLIGMNKEDLCVL